MDVPGRLLRVQHDSLGYLYEIVVAGEIIRDVETSWRNRKIDHKGNTGLWVFLLVACLPLTIIGYLLSLRGPCNRHRCRDNAARR